MSEHETSYGTVTEETAPSPERVAQTINQLQTEERLSARSLATALGISRRQSGNILKTYSSSVGKGGIGTMTAGDTPGPQLTAADFLAKLYIAPQARARTEEVVERWHQWRRENGAEYLTAHDITAALLARDIQIDEEWTVGLTLEKPRTVPISDFLSKLYFHERASMPHAELESLFWQWRREQNATAGLNSALAALTDYGCTQAGDVWHGCSLKDSPEDAARFPPCSACLQARWVRSPGRKDGGYQCGTCGAQDIAVHATVVSSEAIGTHGAWLTLAIRTRYQEVPVLRLGASVNRQKVPGKLPHVGTHLVVKGVVTVQRDTYSEVESAELRVDDIDAA